MPLKGEEIGVVFFVATSRGVFVIISPVADEGVLLAHWLAPVLSMSRKAGYVTPGGSPAARDFFSHADVHPIDC